MSRITLICFLVTLVVASCCSAGVKVSGQKDQNGGSGAGNEEGHNGHEHGHYGSNNKPHIHNNGNGEKDYSDGEEVEANVDTKGSGEVQLGGGIAGGNGKANRKSEKGGKLQTTLG